MEPLNNQPVLCPVPKMVVFRDFQLEQCKADGPLAFSMHRCCTSGTSMFGHHRCPHLAGVFYITAVLGCQRAFASTVPWEPSSLQGTSQKLDCGSLVPQFPAFKMETIFIIIICILSTKEPHSQSRTTIGPVPKNTSLSFLSALVHLACVDIKGP